MNGSISKLRKQARSYFQKSRLREAFGLYEEICNTDPDHESLHNLGIICSKMGDHARAENLLMHAIKLKQDSDTYWDNLGVTQLASGKHQAAVSSLNNALQLNPGNTHALNTLGSLYMQAGNMQQAIQFFDRAYSADKNNPLTLNHLGTFHLHRCDYTQAIKYYKAALKLNKQYYDVIFNMGSAYHSMGDLEKAIEFYQRAHRLNPEDSRPVSAIASVYENQGEYTQAEDILSTFLKTGSQAPDAILQSAKIHLHTKRYDEGIQKVLRCMASQKLNPVQHEELAYVLGTLYDKTGQYDQAFEAYRKGNEIRPFQYDRASSETFFEAIQKNFETDDIPQSTIATSQHAVSPVFIIGMPRSGTTLIEQILSSHSDIAGAGELPYINEIANTIGNMNGIAERYPNYADAVPTHMLDEKARKYIDHITRISSDKPMVTDKMPHNFIYVGLIRMLFPECKIINCLRDPLDICLSIYFHNFNTNHPYSDKLSNLGHYYNQYRYLMEFWNKRFDDIYTVTYADIIESPEQEIRSLCDYLSVEFQQSCLQFYDNDRVISTPSYSQVSKPLYTSSMARWRNYEKYLGDLKASLAE